MNTEPKSSSHRDAMLILDSLERERSSEMELY